MSSKKNVLFGPSSFSQSELIVVNTPEEQVKRSIVPGDLVVHRHGHHLLGTVISCDGAQVCFVIWSSQPPTSWFYASRRRGNLV